MCYFVYNESFTFDTVNLPSIDISIKSKRQKRNYNLLCLTLVSFHGPSVSIVEL